MPEHAVGIDLGGTYIKAGVVDDSGSIVHQSSRPTNVEEGLDAIVASMADAAERAVSQSGVGWGGVRAVGVGSPGVLDADSGIVLGSPNLRCMEGAPVGRLVAERLGREVPVRLENDANAAAYGEFWIGVGRRIDSLVLMTLGTGIGGGIVLNGEIWHGAHGFGGEIGHHAIFADGRMCACGNQGCLETYASAGALERRFAESVKAGRPTSLADAVRARGKATGREIYRAAVEGDAAAREALQETGRFLGVAVANLYHIFDPDMVAFAGGLTGAGDMLLEPIRREARARMFPSVAERASIAFAALGADAGLIGAAGWALKTYETSAS